MIGVIFSYVKSALVLAVMTCACVAGIVCVCLFTAETYHLVIRIVGFALLFFASYLASMAYALKLLAAQIADLGGRQCDNEALGERLRRLSRRAVFGRVRGEILVQYAATQVYRGMYAQALETLSDAVIAGKDGVKGDAAVYFAYLFFLKGDADYFRHYYQTAVDNRKACVSAAKENCVRAAANAQLTALYAMRLHTDGDTASALARIRDFSPDDAPLQQQKNLAALCDYLVSLPATADA